MSNFFNSFKMFVNPQFPVNAPKKESISPDFIIMPIVQPGPDSYNKDRIKFLAKYGLNDAPPEDRALAWLVFLEVYPSNPNEWEEVKKRKMDDYIMYQNEFKLTDFHTKSFPQYVKKEAFELGDNAKDSLMMLIHGDIVRTGRHIFKLPEWRLEGVEYQETSGNDPNILLWEGHLRRLERILFILGSMNKAQSYMQGFNELLLPIYYTLFKAKSLFNGDIDYVECLSFYCLQQLIAMTEITDLFTTQDKSSILIYKLKGFLEVLNHHAPISAEIIQKHDIHPVCYCFKWFSLLFSQDYEIPTLLLIWDSILSHFDELLRYSFYVGAAQVKLIENQLSDKDYGKTLNVLQNIPKINVHEMLTLANNWWEIDGDDSAVGMIKSGVEQAKNLFGKAGKFLTNTLENIKFPQPL